MGTALDLMTCRVCFGVRRHLVLYSCCRKSIVSVVQYNQQLPLLHNMTHLGSALQRPFSAAQQGQPFHQPARTTDRNKNISNMKKMGYILWGSCVQVSFPWTAYSFIFEALFRHFFHHRKDWICAACRLVCSFFLQKQLCCLWMQGKYFHSDLLMIHLLRGDTMNGYGSMNLTLEVDTAEQQCVNIRAMMQQKS